MSSQDNNDGQYGSQGYGYSSQDSIPCAQVYVPPTDSQEQRWWDESEIGRDFLSQQQRERERNISPLDLPWEQNTQPTQDVSGTSSWSYHTQQDTWSSGLTYEPPSFTQYESQTQSDPWQAYNTSPPQYATNTQEYTHSQLAWMAENQLTDTQRREFWGGGIDSSDDSFNNGNRW